MAAKADRVKTDIEGFDELVEGGLPRNSMTLISGSPGTGKTTLALQFLHSGATSYKENGVYVTLGEPIINLKTAAKKLGMDFDRLEKDGKIVFVEYDLMDREFLQKIENAVRSIGAKRLVIDSLASLMSYAPFMESAKEGSERMVEWGKDLVVMPAVIGENMGRIFMHKLLQKLRMVNCTTLLITEQPEEDKWLSRDTISEFMCDGVIVLKALSLTGEVGRSLAVRKMRMTEHTLDVHGLVITGKGLKVLPVERGVKI